MCKGCETLHETPGPASRTNPTTPNFSCILQNPKPGSKKTPVRDPSPSYHCLLLLLYTTPRIAQAKQFSLTPPGMYTYSTRDLCGYLDVGRSGGITGRVHEDRTGRGEEGRDHGEGRWYICTFSQTSREWVHEIRHCDSSSSRRMLFHSSAIRTHGEYCMNLQLTFQANTSLFLYGAPCRFHCSRATKQTTNRTLPMLRSCEFTYSSWR